MTRRTVRDAWYEAVIKTTLVNGACRELLSLMAVRHMTERGYVRVPRKVLAAELGIIEHRVTVRTAEAVKAGLLVRVSGGVNGQTVQYAAQLPPTQGVAERHPQRRVEGVAEAAPGGVAERHPETAPEGQPGCRRTTPIRARATYKNREQQPAPNGSRVERDHLHPVRSIDQAPDHAGRHLTAAVLDHAREATQ